MPCEISAAEQAAWANRCLAVRIFNYIAEAVGSSERVNERQTNLRTEHVYDRICPMLKALDPKRRDEIIYDARHSTARKLADWWEYHQEQDQRREAEKQREAERRELRRAAARKLTRAERLAAGLNEDE